MGKSDNADLFAFYLKKIDFCSKIQIFIVFNTEIDEKGKTLV